MPVEKWTRKANAKENKLFSKAKKLKSILTLKMDMTSLQILNYEIALDFAKQNKIDLIQPTNEEYAAHIERRKKLGYLTKWLEWVEEGKLAIRITGNDDFDILAPPDLTDDEIAAYKYPTLSGWIGVAALGILIVAGLISVIYLMMNDNDVLSQKLQNLLDIADAKFCSDPNSAMCQAWLQKKATDYDKRKGLIDQIKDAVSKAVAALGKATTSGVMIAIPILALYFAMSWKGKKK